MRPLVVVIEDDPTQFQLLAEVLRQSGYQVHDASRKPTLPRRAAAAIFDWILPASMEQNRDRLITELQHRDLPICFYSASPGMVIAPEGVAVLEKHAEDYSVTDWLREQGVS